MRRFLNDKVLYIGQFDTTRSLLTLGNVANPLTIIVVRSLHPGIQLLVYIKYEFPSLLVHNLALSCFFFDFKSQSTKLVTHITILITKMIHNHIRTPIIHSVDVGDALVCSMTVRSHVTTL